jgi:hypothetical protein
VAKSLAARTHGGARLVLVFAAVVRHARRALQRRGYEAGPDRPKLDISPFELVACEPTLRVPANLPSSIRSLPSRCHL